MAVADEREEGCDGCERTLPLSELTAVTMPGGDALACCPDCAPYAREVAQQLERRRSERRSCDGCRQSLTARALEEVVLPDGTVIECCAQCRAQAPTGDGSDHDRSTEGAVESTDLATPRSLCGQCHSHFEEELYHVVLADGRTEELCEDCRNRAEREGIVRTVKMRRREAREVLGVSRDASEREIRQAFLRSVKHSHPDRDGGTKAAFQLVKDAYDRLS